RTPLTSIRGYAELYRMGGDPEMVLSKIDEESARMQLLVEDLLALTRAEGARLNKNPVDVLELVMSVKDTARGAFPDRKLEVVADTPEVAVVNGDPDRLYQVLLNLVTNAFKHGGPEAEVTVTVRHN
ncbi:sensor histidine kinase, partial [Burkholderia cenocepacia]|uniref:sensor histidine kinase n=1 Tax=Burkholderia cenocepacia TaxID=95486 RepID=UPI00223719DA